MEKNVNLFCEYSLYSPHNRLCREPYNIIGHFLPLKQTRLKVYSQSSAPTYCFPVLIAGTGHVVEENLRKKEETFDGYYF